DTNEAHSALRLELRDAREQHTGSRDQVAPGLEPDFELRVLGAHRSEECIEPGEIDAGLLGTLGDSQSATHVDDAYFSESSGCRPEQPCRVLPAGDVEDAAPDVGLEPDDPRSTRAGEPRGLRDLGDRDAELRAAAGGAHMLVVTAADSGVDAYED